MNEIIDQMVELYFLGGNIYEMLAEYKLILGGMCIEKSY